MRNYIYQLKDGKMLVLEDDVISVEETGYPYPDCILDVGKVFRGQEQVLEAILGYSVSVPTEFISYCLTIEEPIPLRDFKNKIYCDNIGGGCPYTLRRYARNLLDGFTELGSLFINLIPDELLKEEFDLPEDSELEKYESILRLGKTGKFIKSFTFRQYMLVYMNITKTEEFVELITLALKTIVTDEFRRKFEICSAVKAVNGRGCIILCKDVEYNHDLKYIYSKLAGVNLADGNVIIENDGENLSMHFECIDESLKDYYASKPTFRGTFKRYNI